MDIEEKVKKKLVYWRVAAAILLLLMSGAGWLGIHHHSPLYSLADETNVDTEAPNEVGKHLGKDSAQSTLENNTATADQPEEERLEKKNITPVTKSKPDEIKKVEKRQNRARQTPQPTLASAEIEKMDTTEMQPIENIQSIEKLAIEPLTIVQNELLALESVKSRVSTSVTIIYKPGTTSADQLEETEDKGLAMELLNDIKNSSISFSDIRNAKAELLAKVFSKKENEVTP
ncbi:hypothetical protein [Catalinimonas niigatensis]|uniref:hypothetical protein n=1 Tax=Catalinimonas niigatensis TaxID=1397264 RepID=UPI00266687CB|nr:hypothetical protein [Catalinimonas niigatensis]WPP50574.1 hypothetical protein PZB72_28320 [Catalinimonas niigatensis]